MHRRLPPDLATDEAQAIGVLADEVAAAKEAARIVREDLRFEHLDHPDDAVWRFVEECWALRPTDHVPLFVERHAHEVTRATCYLPVEFLTVTTETQLPGVLLMPVTDPRVPPAKPWFTLEQPTGCVAAVEVDGTEYGRMAERARARTRNVLRGIRIALGGKVHDRQLRFRLGIGYAFDSRLSGWNQPDDAYGITLAEDTAELLSHPAMSVAVEATSDVERKAALAMSWMERACLTGDQLIALLYRFFALEALLGDKSEGLKAHGLAFREMMLSHVVTGGFRHPNKTFFFYDQVRSAAVHGEEVPPISWRDTNMEWAVRETLNDYLAFARDRTISRRGKLLQALDDHSDRPQLIAWLRQNGGATWTRYLDKLEGTPC
jgi:hypothetical protein